LLGSVGDARQFLDENDLEGWELFSLHPAVDDHLASLGVPCAALSRFASIEDQRGIKMGLYPGGALHAEAARILSSLDALVPQDFQDTLGLARPIAPFTSMHAFMFAHGLWGKALFEAAMRGLLGVRRVEEVAVYDTEAEYLYFTAREALESNLAREADFALRVMAPDGRPRHEGLPDGLFSPLPALTRPPRPAEEKPSRPWSHGGERTLLLLEPVYDMHPLLSKALPFHLMVWPYEGLPRVEGLDVAAMAERGSAMAGRLSGAMAAASIEGLPASYQERLRKDTARHGEVRLTGLALLDTLLREGRVHALAWGNSAGAAPANALLTRYAMGAGIPVIGMQHGGNGVQDLSYFGVIAEFSMCTHYFGYGHAKEDLPSALLPFADCKIMPVGSTRLPTAKSIKEYEPVRGRVLFPITNSISILDGGRISPDFLAQAQCDILQALEKRPDLDIWVKPFMGSTSKNFACARLLAGLRNLRVTGEFFPHALEALRPELLVVEYPSSPLFEALPFDVDIFALADPLFPFTEAAMAMLDRRVHFFHSAKDLTAALAEYGKSPLPRLRGEEFFQTFLHRPDPEEELVSQTTALVETGSALSAPQPPLHAAMPAQTPGNDHERQRHYS
jgi:hypothetical protein